jgi:hypothetical protein
MHVAMYYPDDGRIADVAESAVPHAVARGWELVEPDRPAPEPDPPAQAPAPPADKE